MLHVVHLSQPFLPTYLHRALVVWAACHDFHSFKTTLKAHFNPFCKSLHAHHCVTVASLLNFFSIPLLFFNLATEFTSTVASHGPYFQILWWTMWSWSQRLSKHPHLCTQPSFPHSLTIPLTISSLHLFQIFIFLFQNFQWTSYSFPHENLVICNLLPPTPSPLLIIHILVNEISPL